MFQQRLRTVREDAGLSQEELAVLADIEPLQVWRYENGRSKPNTEFVAKLAKALNVSSDFLLGLSDDPTPHDLTGGLSALERAVLSALRRGDNYEAIKAITASEK